MFVVIEAGGKQHRVSVGDILEVDRMQAPVGSTINLDRVLLVSDGASITTGNPTVAEAHVVSTVLARTRGPKIIVFRYKAKKRVRKKTGHRQDLSRLRIDDIVVAGESRASRSTAERPAAETVTEASEA